MTPRGGGESWFWSSEPMMILATTNPQWLECSPASLSVGAFFLQDIPAPIRFGSISYDYRAVVENGFPVLWLNHKRPVQRGHRR
jgi:hypothetical protein